MWTFNNKCLPTLLSGWLGPRDLVRPQQSVSDRSTQAAQRQPLYIYHEDCCYCKSIGLSNSAVMNPAVSEQFKVRLCWLLSCFFSLSYKHAFVLVKLMISFGSLPSVFAFSKCPKLTLKTLIFERAL